MPLPVGFELEEKEETQGIAPKLPEGFALEEKPKITLEPTLPQYLKFKLYSDRASSERSKYGKEAMWGRMDSQQALTKGNEERDYWMTQAGQYEDLSFKKHPFAYVAGETVQLLPYMIASQKEGLKAGLTLGGGFAAITAIAGQVGPQVAFPEEIITVPVAFGAGMKTGYAYGVIKNILDREGGSLYLDMVEKGISPKTARPLALAGGTLIGVIELAQFKLLGKPFKQALSKTVNSGIGKKAIAGVLGRYVNTVLGEVTEEELQEVTSLVTETIAGVIEDNPNATPTKEEWGQRLLETAKRAGAGLAVISLPGAGVDVATSVKTEKTTAKAKGAMLDKIIAELPVEEKPEIKLPEIEAKPKIEREVFLENEIPEGYTKEEWSNLVPEEKNEIQNYLMEQQYKQETRGMEEQTLEQAIIELGGIKFEYTTIKGRKVLVEEYRELPRKLRGELALDDIATELSSQGFHFRDGEELRQKILASQKASIRAGELINKIESGIKRDKLKTKKEITTLQTELINLVEESGLVPKDKAKFLRTIRSIQSREQLQKAIPKIEKIREQTQRSELVSDLRKTFKKQPTKNLPIEYKEIIENKKSEILLKQRRPKTKARLESMRQFIERMAEQGEEINIPQEKLDLLDKRSVDEMTTQELSDLKETIQRLYHQGRLKNKLLTAQEGRRFDSLKSEIVNVITQGQGLNEDSTIVKALREQNESLKGQTLEKIKNYIIENMRPELMLSLLDGGVPGIVSNTVFNPLWESQKSELNESQKVIDTIKDIHKDLNYAEFFNKKYDVGRFEGITKDQMGFIYANSFNDSNRAHLTGSGITDEDISAIDNFLSDKEKQAVNDMIRLYDYYQYPILDRIFMELEGAHLGKEDNYFPIDRLEDISYNKELEKDILERNYVRKAGVTKGFTKERVTSTKGFTEFSYFGTILRNYRKVEHYKAFAKSIRDANKVLNNNKIKTAINDNFGEKYHQTLDKWLKDVAYGGGKQSMASIDKFVQWLRTNYAVAVIGGNLSSVMKAPVSFIQGAEMAGKWNTTKALQKFILAPLEWDSKINEKSTLMKFRPMRSERELGEIISQRTTRGQISKLTGYQLIREKSMMPWVIADKTTCDIIWLASYEGALSDNMTEKQAIDHADMVIRRTQPTSGALNLPDTFRGPEYQKLFTLFRNQPNQNFNLLLESVLKKQKGKISNTQFMSNTVWYLLVPSVLFGVISRKRLPEDIGELARDILNGALGGLIYLGNITNMMTMGFMGATTPIESLYEDIYNAYRSKDIWKKLDNLANMISKLVGFPYLAIKRIAKGEPFGRPAKKKKGEKLKKI